jgi:hypothetical protein
MGRTAHEHIAPSELPRPVVTPRSTLFQGEDMARDICIKLADGSQYCKRSPIRDCGCDRDPTFQDPFGEIPRDIDPSTFSTDLEKVLSFRPKGADPASHAERLRLILVIARLIMLPKDIDQAFVISALDFPPILPAPIPPAEAH